MGDISATPASDTIYSFRRLPITQRKPTKAEGAAIAAAETALAEAEARYYDMEVEDDENDEQYNEIERQYETAQEALEEAARGAGTVDAEAKGIAGALATISAEGVPMVYRGLVKPQDSARANKALHGVQGDDEEKGTAPPPKPEFSERLQRDLTAHRTIALKATLARNANVALVVVVPISSWKFSSAMLGCLRSARSSSPFPTRGMR